MVVSKRIQNSLLSMLYFLLSTIITWWFIEKGKTLYFSTNKMLLSCAIAGAKWSIQIAAAYFLLKDKKWDFIKRIGFTCFVGSCILLPYCLFPSIHVLRNSFLFSLIAAVLVMIVMYYKAVIKMDISTKWFWGWVCCLVVAILLQLFVVFKII